jgi:hypothetical protein
MTGNPSPSCKFIYVCGHPRGGTSAVTRLLMNLGVDMGNFPMHTKAEYESYECRDGRVFNQMEPTPQHAQMLESCSRTSS